MHGKKIAQKAGALGKGGVEVHSKLERGGCAFIEVKTSRFAEQNVFELSMPEWAFMSAEPPVRLDLYRVNLVPSGATITVVEDALAALKAGSVRLCMAV